MPVHPPFSPLQVDRAVLRVRDAAAAVPCVAATGAAP